MEIPFDEITESLDRSWSSRLVDIIESPPDDDIADEAAEVLSELVDPAATSRLFGIATSPRLDPKARERALYVINESGLDPAGDALRIWWNSGDPVLQVAALKCAHLTEADYLRTVASDPLHPMYCHAIVGLETGFDIGEWQAYVVVALSHFDEATREAAADVAIWEEPVAATDGLINLAFGASQEVACQAIRTLRYFKSRRVLVALEQLLDHSDTDRADDARDALGDLCEDFRQAAIDEDLSSEARQSLDKWMQPVADIIAVNHLERFYGGYESDQRVPEPLPPAVTVAAMFEDVSGPWAHKFALLRNADWTTVADCDRKLLRPVLLGHIDPIVRRDASRVFRQWDDVDAVVELVHDKYGMVRNSALFWSGNLTPSLEVAELAKNTLESRAFGGWPADEALTSWRHHFNGDPNDYLVELALTDPRQHVRWSALNYLDSSRVHDVETLLQTPPDINWLLHVSVLEHFLEEKRIPRGLDAFSEVDDLGIAVAYSQLVALER